MYRMSEQGSGQRGRRRDRRSEPEILADMESADLTDTYNAKLSYRQIAAFMEIMAWSEPDEEFLDREQRLWDRLRIIGQKRGLL